MKEAEAREDELKAENVALKESQKQSQAKVNNLEGQLRQMYDELAQEQSIDKLKQKLKKLEEDAKRPRKTCPKCNKLSTY